MANREDDNYPEEPNFLNNDCSINEEWVLWFKGFNPDLDTKLFAGVILTKMVIYQARIKEVVGLCWEPHHADMELVLKHNESLRTAFLNADFSKPSLWHRFLHWLKQ